MYKTKIVLRDLPLQLETYPPILEYYYQGQRVTSQELGSDNDLRLPCVRYNIKIYIEN